MSSLVDGEPQEASEKVERDRGSLRRFLLMRDRGRWRQAAGRKKVGA